MEDIIKTGLVCFDHDMRDGIIINATEMAKPFNKKPSDWLRLRSAKNFLGALAKVKGVQAEKLVLKFPQSINVKKKDIWLHEDAALEFARWLSPSFAISSNKYTKQLLINANTQSIGIAKPFSTLTSVLLQRTKSFDEVMGTQVFKALYHETVLQSGTLISTTLIAKELGMSAKALNRILHEKKIIYKTEGHWVLYVDYQGRGYTGTKTALYIDSKGKYNTNIHTYWTEKGREFIHAIFQDVKQTA